MVQKAMDTDAMLLQNLWPGAGAGGGASSQLTAASGILVTGATGFVGGHFLSALLERRDSSAPVFCLVRVRNSTAVDAADGAGSPPENYARSIRAERMLGRREHGGQDRRAADHEHR